jgi:hypothetical protein
MTIEKTSADGHVHRFPDGTKQVVIDKVMKEYARRGRPNRPSVQPTPADIGVMDTQGLKQGAPAGVRAAVGSVPDAAKLQALQRYFPDAAPIGESGNFVYSDPETGEGVLYNPSGVDVGDIPSILPEIGEAAGGALGAAGGVAMGAPGGIPGMVVGGMAGAGTGAMAGRELVERGSMALQDIEDPRTAFEQTISAGTTFAVNAFGQGIGPLASQGIRAGTKGLLRGFGSRTATQNAINDLARFGETPSWGGATDSAAIDTLESFFAAVPGAAGIIRNKAAQTSENIARNITVKVNGLAGRSSTPFEAGKVVEEGIQSFARNFNDKASALYGKLDTFIPAQTPMDVGRTRAILKELTTPVPGAENISAALRNPTLAKIAEALESDVAKTNGTAQFDVVKNLRSAIGRRLGTTSLTDDIPKAELKRVYAALSSDMRIAAQQQGDQALKAFDRASNYYKAGIQRIDDMLEPLVKNKVPEQTYAALEQSAKAGPTRIRALRQSVTPEQWRIVAGTMVERLGKGAAGQQGVEAERFSMTNFLKNYETIRSSAGDDTLDVLFGGPGMAGMKKDLDALARASERMKRSSQAFANPSGTARVAIGGAMLASAAVSAVTMNPGPIAGMFLAMGVANRSAKLMTSPNFVRWLAQGTNISPNGISAHIGRLTTIAASSDADTRDAIEEFARDLSQIGQQ